MNIVKGICYSVLNQKEKAIKIFLEQLNTKSYVAGLYDYYQLGVTYYQIKDYKNALKAFEKQSQRNDIAENAYYKSKIYKALKNNQKYQENKELALKLYAENKKLQDPYTQHTNSVYYSSIVSE